MLDPVRQEIVNHADTLVVKIGTNVLADATGQLDRERVQSLADQLARARFGGRKVVLVTSGAIGAGVGKLGLNRRPTDLAYLQACAAVGQSALMQLYQESLEPHGVRTAQILLTASDFDNRARYLNVRNTIRTLFEYAVLPIINENDTVSVAEIKFGDNDRLAAMVTNLLRAPLLVLLTNVDGLYSDDPRANPDATLVSTVPQIDKTVTEYASSATSELGSGGMRSKLRAARLATAAGESVIIANGSLERILDHILAAEPVGTLFLPHGQDVPAWKRWIGFTAQPRGIIRVDAGARRALVEQGKSLLMVGVVEVRGVFGKGDVVSICDDLGIEVARGLCNYNSEDVIRLRGLQSEQIASLLGRAAYPELVHRDNLALVS